MTQSFWSFAFPLWAIVLGVLFACAAVVLAVFNVLRNRDRVRASLAELVRMAGVALIIFTLFRPERVRLTERMERPLVAVLADASGSMGTRDVVTTNASAVSRAEWLGEQEAQRFWSPLEERYDVVLMPFSPPPPATTNETEVEIGTDINGALEQALREHGNLRAVLLLSDGDWNLGQPPVAAATKLRMREVPVFSIVAGSDSYLPDIELLSVAAPAYGLMDEYVSVAFTVQSRLPRDVKTTVSLHGESGLEADKDVVIPASAQLQGTIMLVPKAEGDFTFTLKVPVEKDEILADNNAREFPLSLRREILKVLLIEGEPRWEYRYLHNALDRDPGVIVRCLLFNPGIQRGRGRNYIPAFPGTRDDLSQYDVVFLGDVGIGSDQLSEDAVRLLKGLVEQQGSGLVFLPGRKTRQQSLLSSELGELMPVETDSVAAGFGIGMESRLTLTARGRDHFLTMLAPTPAGNAEVWRRLPGFYWHAGVVRAKAGSDVIAVHSAARNEHGRVPLLVTKPAGNGKVLFMGTDSAWRWRRGVEDTYHYRFWGQVVRWMAHQRHLAHEEGIRFFYNPESPRKGDRVFLHATAFNDAGFPLEKGTVHVMLSDEGGHTQRVRLEPEPGGWGVFTGTAVLRRGGRHDVKVSCEETEREVATHIDVERPTRERVGRPARADVLREVSAITGGRCGATSELAAVLEDMRLLPEPRPREERFRLWCHPAWGGLLVAIMALYWVIRKLMGRI